MCVLGLCFHLKGCGNSGSAEKCPCRRLESVLPEDSKDHPGRMLSSRRRRTFTTNEEYSEVCCDDWDPGSTFTTEPWPTWEPFDWRTTEAETETSSTTSTTSTSTTVAWTHPEGPVYTLQNITWSSVSFLEETFDAGSCEGDWTRDNAWIALNLCITLNTYKQFSEMFTLTDGVLLFAQWSGSECLGTPEWVEQFPTDCSFGTSKALQKLGPSMAEGPWTPTGNGTWNKNWILDLCKDPS